MLGSLDRRDLIACECRHSILYLGIVQEPRQMDSSVKVVKTSELQDKSATNGRMASGGVAAPVKLHTTCLQPRSIRTVFWFFSQLDMAKTGRSMSSYICKYINTYTYVCIYIHVNKCIYVRINIYIFTYICVCVCVCVFVCVLV